MMGKLGLSLVQVLKGWHHRSELYLLYVSVSLQPDIVPYHCQLQLEYNQKLIFWESLKILYLNRVIQKQLFVYLYPTFNFEWPAFGMAAVNAVTTWTTIINHSTPVATMTCICKTIKAFWRSLYWSDQCH